MSAQDDINISDEEFDAFLKGEGDLALMLRQLPQVQPSAQLDDAILAAAKVELAASSETAAVATVQSMQQAANDPVMPGKAKSNRSFANRWRIPLGLAASLFVTVQLVRMEVYDERMKPSAPALLVEKVPAPAEIASPVESSVIAPPSVAVKIVPPPGYEPPQGITAKPAAPAPASPAAIEAAQAIAAAASQPVEKQKRKRASEQDEQRQAAEKVAPPPLVVAPAPEHPAKLARRESQDPATVYGIINPAPAPMPAPARAVVAPDSAKAEEQPVQRVEITGSMIRRADTETAESVQVVTSAEIKKSGDAVGDADAQLAKISTLLKSGSTPQALAEWRKFRHTHPDYKVPEELRAKIDALLNQQTLDSGP